MLLSRSAILVVLASFGLRFACWQADLFAQNVQPAEQMAVRDPPVDCDVTLPSEGSFVPTSPLPVGLAANQFWFGTEKLWARLPIDGIWWGSIPRKRGDFVYDDKFFWLRAYPGFSKKDAWLTIEGKRLDGQAPTFTESYHHYASDRTDDNMMIVGGMSIPVFGCWRIMARYSDQDLSFTVWVTPSNQRPLPDGSSSQETSQESSVGARRRIHVDGEEQARLLVYRVAPEIPQEAPVAEVSGAVVLHAIIKDGRPSDLLYVSGPPLLAQAAIDAVTWWRYMMLTDEPTEIDTTIQVVFPSAHN